MMMMANRPSDFSVRQVPAAGGSVTLVEFLDRRLIDAAHIEQIGEQLLDLVNAAAKPRLLLNFERVEYLSSTTLNVLIELDNAIKRRGGELRLTNLAPDLHKVFTLMKLHKVMTICTTVEDGVKSFA